MEITQWWSTCLACVALGSIPRTTQRKIDEKRKERKRKKKASRKAGTTTDLGTETK